MDFMRLLKSFEEFIYEVASWIVFYPVTLWRTLRYPMKMMRYADVELDDAEPEQYIDTLSPPLFLLVTLLLIHGGEIAFASLEAKWVRPSLLASDANLLGFRAIVYSIFPLLMAVALLRRSGTALNRETLRPPFYSQCYVTGPLALGHGVAGQLALVAAPNAVAAGLVVFALTMIWYVVVETRWFRADLKISTAKAAMIVVVTTCEALILMVAIVAFVAVAAG
jgi:hypothetical protein